MQQTWGTETSKYPEEKKSIEIPLVVASESGSSLNHTCVKRTGVACAGSWDHSGGAVSLQQVTKVEVSRTVWKGRPQRVTAP